MASHAPIGAPSIDRADMLGGLAALIERVRLPLSDEKDTQAALVELFRANGIAFLREASLGDGDIVDFLIPGIDRNLDAPPLALEVKIKGPRRAIFRQCQRCCAHESVGALLLATNVVMNLPSPLNGKPTAVAQLGRGWL
jgi:hypothetical protein